MQDLHAIAGGTMFGATAAVDRRLRPLGLQSAHQALKCPRCDSLNTKFCYYNNYNLSQPRYFCKSCRRYWTKGGVLRNVPIGGGCRKNKRSKIKTSSAEAPAGAEDEIPIAMQQQTIDRKSSSHSSSESSSLTAATTEAVSAPTSAASPASLLNILEYNSLAMAGDSNTAGTCFGRSLLEQGPESVGFADIGGLTGTGLITASSSEPIQGGFTFGGSQQSQETCHQNQWQQQDQIPGAFLDQTVQVNLSALQGRFGPFDWQTNKDPVVFDLPPNTVDQAYWSQSQIQWTDQDQPGLYLP